MVASKFSKSEEYKFFYLLIYLLPSQLMIFTYSLIFLQLINFMFRSHLELGTAFKKSQDKTKFHTFSYIFVLLIITGYLIIQVIFAFLIVFSKIDENLFRKQLSIVTLILVFSYLVIMTYLYFYFSGIPFKSITHQEKTRKMCIIFAIWTVCMIPKPILSFSDSNFFVFLETY